MNHGQLSPLKLASVKLEKRIATKKPNSNRPQSGLSNDCGRLSGAGRDNQAEMAHRGPIAQIDAAQ